MQAPSLKTLKPRMDTVKNVLLLSFHVKLKPFILFITTPTREALWDRVSHPGLARETWEGSNGHL